MEVTTIHPDDTAQAQQLAQQAAEVLRAGGLVVFPTETVYGIAALASSSGGLAALRQFKQREDEQPFTLHLSDIAAIEHYADTSGPMFRRLLRKTMPGPITLVVDVPAEETAQRVEAMLQRGWFAELEQSLGHEQAVAEVLSRLYHGGTVGVRVPDMPIAQRILAAVAGPVVASSANRRGQSPPRDADEAASAVEDAADLIVDGGRCRYAKPSTIVCIRQTEHGERIEVQREGVYDERFIRKLLRWTMLLVCSGNTCRSPMAEGIARQLLAQQRGVPEAELETAGVRVVSAGSYAVHGLPASADAVDALREQGVDLSRHRSNPLTPGLIHEADVIYCMTQSHLRAVLDMVPAAAERTFLLSPDGDVEDPIGQGPQVYQRSSQLIRKSLEQRLEEQGP